jgi:serine/threonine protein kinase
MPNLVTQRSVNNVFYQFTDILYYTRDTRVYIGHPLETPKHKYAIKKPIPIGRVNLVKKEANTLRQIVHPNVIRYIDHSEDPTEPYLVMELADETLDGLIWKEKISKEMIAKYLLEMPSFLNLFHRLGIAHTNINPGNLGYDRSMNLKILDFSDAISCQYPSKQKIKCNSASILSPEFLSMGEITPTTDTYCAARVFECLLFGDYIVANEPIIMIQEHYGHLPDSFFTLYRDMTKENPLERLKGLKLQERVELVIHDLEHVEIFTSNLLAGVE